MKYNKSLIIRTSSTAINENEFSIIHTSSQYCNFQTASMNNLYDWYNFNWSDYPDIIHIHIYIYYSSQNICIRSNGFRCIRYTACSETNSFTVSGPAITNVGTLCSLDFVEITGAFGCGSMDNFTPHLADRICGEVFGTVVQVSAAPMAVCGKISL